LTFHSRRFFIRAKPDSFHGKPQRGREGRKNLHDGGGLEHAMVFVIRHKIVALVNGLLEIIGGWYDYRRYPEQRDRWGGPFNGQSARRALVQELIAAFHPVAIIETGTFHATTTEYLAQAGLPVLTIEGNQRNFGFSLHRLWWRPNVTMRIGDSRAGLVSLLDGCLRRQRDENLFFYLDAHWNEDLPLADEIDIIFSRCPAAIVMIDDFEVPDDPDYGFDDYGGGNALNETYIAPQVQAHRLSLFYPSIRAENEDGAKRGCVVLARTSVHGAALGMLSLLQVRHRHSALVDSLDV
jgi:hypothetical protein